jgi:hypothetical protein
MRGVASLLAYEHNAAQESLVSGTHAIYLSQLNQVPTSSTMNEVMQRAIAFSRVRPALYAAGWTPKKMFGFMDTDRCQPCIQRRATNAPCSECIRCLVLERPGETRADVLVSLTDTLIELKGYRSDVVARKRECSVHST